MSANWNNPTTSSTYANFVAEVKARDEDVALAFDPAYTTPTNLATNTVSWSSASNKWRKWSGTAWVDLTGMYAINISGSAASITGVAAPANGGTGLSSYTIGDLLFASGATALSKLSAIATGNVLLSGGTGTAPSWGKVGLTSHVSGTLAVANGGTGAATLSGVAFGNGTGAFTAATAAQLVAAIGSTYVSNASWATNANYANSAGNADTLDGYHYNNLPYAAAGVYAGINSNFDWELVLNATIASNATIYVLSNYGYGIYYYTTSGTSGIIITCGNGATLTMGSSGTVTTVTAFDLLSNSGSGGRTLYLYKLRKIA